MTAYRFEARDMRTGTLLGEVPLGGVSYSEVLNGAGAMTARLDLAGYTAGGRRRSASYLQAIIPGRTALYPIRGNRVMGEYHVTDEPSKAMGDRSWAIRAEQAWSYFHDRTLNVTKKYVNADQFFIARDLINYAQAVGGGNIRVQVPATLSGVVRAREYFSYERNTIGELVEQLAAVDGGFDFAITTDMVGGVPVSTFRLYYPRRGRRAIDNGLVFNGGTFTLQKNLRDYSVGPGPKSAVTTIHALGAGEDFLMLISTSVDNSLIQQGYPLREDVLSMKDVTVAGTLSAHAVAERKARARQLRQFVLDVDPDDESTGLGQWQVGDDARVIIGQDERFPDGLDTNLRIVDQTVTVPDDGGPDTVLLGMGDPLG